MALSGTRVSAECDDLQRGDIPFFTTRPQSLSVWTSTKRCIPRLIETSSLWHVERRVHELSENNLNLQVWLIRASLAATSIDQSHAAPSLRANVSSSEGLIESSRLLAAACAAGGRLESSAIRSNGTASWIGLTVADEERWNISCAGLDLYDGLPGIALFLAYLGSITGESRFTDLARETCRTMLHRIEKCNPNDMGIGAFAGWGGIVYALSHLGTLWRDPSLLGIAEGIVERLPALVASDKQFDVIGGAAGCIGSLLAFQRLRPASDALLAANACGNICLPKPDNSPAASVRSCRNRLFRSAGSRTALPELAGHSSNSPNVRAKKSSGPEPRLRSCMSGIYSTVRRQSLPDLRTWRVSSAQGKKSPMSAWCHGATGIGMARLASSPTNKQRNTP